MEVTIAFKSRERMVLKAYIGDIGIDVLYTGR
jgi:hypothetical protein